MLARPPVTAPVLSDALRAVDRLSSLIREEAQQSDRNGTFPARSVAALRGAGLLGAAVPLEHGGMGFTAVQLSVLASRLGELCGSTAMIWAMHQIQLACLTAGAGRHPGLARYLHRVTEEQLLIASVTSEEGVGGNLRTSRAALVPVRGGLTLTKRATTVSYAEQADAFLVTARRAPDAPPGDQVLVLVEAPQARIEVTGTWDMLGMRGTCSPACTLTARIPAWQVLDEPFGTIAARWMVPLSHLLWSSVWAGIAADARRRATGVLRRRLRDSTSPPDVRVAWMHARQQLLDAAVARFAADYAEDPDRPGLTVLANALKMQVSLDAVRICEQALEVCGMAGYSEASPWSVARHLRDLYSGRLMISNDRLSTVNAEMLTFGRDDDASG